jgi:hypothetical protein
MKETSMRHDREPALPRETTPRIPLQPHYGRGVFRAGQPLPDIVARVHPTLARLAKDHR